MPSMATNIAASIMKSHDPRGLLMYGSAVTDPASASDVDVICITRNDGHRHFMTTVGQTSVDVYASTRASLETSIRSDKRDNNNFILNAFAHGCPLLKLDDSVDTLMGIADEVWSAGPRQPCPDERKAIELTLIKGLHAARSYVNRAGRNPEWRGLATLNLGQTFLRATYAYCRTHRLWASTLPEMLTWHDDVRYHDLIMLSSIFLRAHSLEEEINVITDITQRAVSKAKKEQ